MEEPSWESFLGKRKNAKVGYALVAAVAMAIMASLPGPLGELEYHPVKHDVAPLKRVRAEWPRMNESALGEFGRVEFGEEEMLFGPESIEFDPQGNGPYTGLGDGRVVRWTGHGWETFALTSSSWTKAVCDNGNNTKLRIKNEHVCGRPLGLRFDPRSGNLFIADSYYGLLVVGPQGGLAKPLVTHIDGVPLKFTNDLDIHPNGSIFFTDTSTRWTRRLHHMVIIEGESSGRLLRYDPGTDSTEVVLRGLAFPNGVQLAKDHSFILVVETTNCRVLKYWIHGESAGKLEVFADLPGYPDNVRANDDGDFWVAVDCCRNGVQEFLSTRPWLKKAVFRLPVPMSWIMLAVGEKLYSLAAKFDHEGRLLHRLEDRESQTVKLISEVYEREGKIWFGTVAHNQIATFTLTST